MAKGLDFEYTPYERIVRAAEAGKGIFLNSADVQHMSNNDAIWTQAQNDASERVPCVCGLPIPAHRRKKDGTPICRKSSI